MQGAGGPDPEAFDELLATMDSGGHDFERLCAWFLQTDPEYAAEFDKVWLWRDWPGNWGRDKGIDLVARKHDGAIVAIQSKHYAATYPVKKADIDSFLAESSRDAIDERLLIATTDLLGANAREVIDGQSRPVSLCLLNRLRTSAVPWPTSVGELSADAPIVLQPRPHQREALEAIARWSESETDRGQVLMACGTGKTLVAVRAADLLSAKLVLVLVPTLPLLRQTAGVWAGQSGISRRAIRVCSDQTDPDSERVWGTGELGFPTTTDPALVTDFLRLEEPRVVFATYNSSSVVAEALAAVPDVSFDLAIADEAHRCAGAAKRSTKMILDAQKIRATRRLFFTATPTQFGTKDKQRARNVNVALASMDDPDLFGPVIHHLSFADAVAQKLLCPYQVAVIPITDDEVQALIDDRRFVTADGTRIFEAEALATQIACARAMRRFGAHRVVAFHPRVIDSRRFSEHFPTAAGLLSEDERPTGRLWSEHIDGAPGGMPRSKRTRVLREFEQPGSDYRLLSNVKLLTEGVDIREIDGIAFVDTQRGSVSVIQAVGRAMRPAEGKLVGTIILPIIVRKDEDITTALNRREHRSIVTILGALRSHDPEIFRSLDDLRFTAAPDQRDQPVRRFVIDAAVEVDEKFADAVDVALTRALGTTTVRPPRRRAEPLLVAPPPDTSLTDEEVLARGLELMQRYAQWRLAPAVPSIVSGFPLQAWWDETKRRWQNGLLAEETKQTIADAVSWLAPDLGRPDSTFRREMRRLTSYSVPEQLDVQLSRQGIHATGALAPLSGDRSFYEDDGLVERLDVIHAQVTHAAMSARTQHHALVAAVRPLARAIEAASSSGEDLHGWDRAAILHGYTDRLLDDDSQLPHWSARSNPESYLAGFAAAQPVLPLVRRMARYRFDGDDSEIFDLLHEDALRAPDDRFDALSWDIYLLARHHDIQRAEAMRLARPTARNPLAARKAVRAQLLRRGIVR